MQTCRRVGGIHGSERLGGFPHCAIWKQLRGQVQGKLDVLSSQEHVPCPSSSTRPPLPLPVPLLSLLPAWCCWDSGFFLGTYPPRTRRERMPAEKCYRVQPSGAQTWSVDFPGCKRGEAWVGTCESPCPQHAFNKGRVVRGMKKTCPPNRMLL